jgi:Ser/Thr protein kinase RdoA (MazF antagonist)
MGAMGTDFAATVLGEFRATARESGWFESRSGAGVHPVRTAGGGDAFLKITPTSSGAEALSAARRELRFYQLMAATAPVRTPALLDHLDTDGGVALLLEAVGEVREAASWTPGMWAALGRDLARLHGTPLPSDMDLDRPDGLRDALAGPDRADITIFWAPMLPRLDELLSRRGELEADLSALSPVFIHGDCHVHNLPYADGSLVFCDWQMAGLGRPTSDLAFPGVRAAPDGVTVPPDLVDAYSDVRPCDRDVLDRALLAEELAILVFMWPPYAAYNGPSGIDRVRLRARDLAARWLAP